MLPQSGSVAPSIPVPEVMAELETILSSTTFATAPRLSRLLRYIVEKSLEGDGSGLKEYQLGVDVFDRKAGYETRNDPVVRVEARQLRYKLADYYGGSGASDDIVISLPKGGYVARFERRAVDAAAEEPAEVPAPEPVKRMGAGRRVRLAVAAVALLVCGLALWAVFGRLRAVTQHHRADPEAEALYLKGRYYWSRRTPEDLNRALDYFTQAVVRDPAYGQAYAGLADTYNLLGEYTAMPRGEAFTRAIAAARRAVALDDNLPEAHSSLAFASFYGAFDFKTADREFKRALALNPSYVAAHHWRATALMSEGRFPEALAEIAKAQELEPASSSILADKGVILWNAGHREQGVALLRQIAASDASLASPHRYLAYAYLAEGDYRNFLTEARTTATLTHDDQALEVVRAQEEGFATNGGPGLLRNRLDAEEKLLARGQGSYYDAAATSAMAGQNDRALELLRLAVDHRDTSIVVMGIDPELDSLRRDPKFRKLVARVGRGM